MVAPPAAEKEARQNPSPSQVGTAASPQGAGAKEPPPLPPPTGKRFALLVGCTKYDNLPSRFHLTGPANDVGLMRHTLKERFAFADGDIVTLAEGPAAAARPTRANIKRQFDRLAQEARAGDQVVILLGGHGSQQPDRPPLDEIDGLDETFLPCDVGAWDGDKGVVANAIVDDELAVWVKAITDRGAAVWLIVDACHSGTLLRGRNPEEVAREIVAGELVPRAALDRARAEAAGRKFPLDGSPFAGSGHFLVGLYAAQPTEPTIERPMPPRGGTTRYGVLTYTLCQILTRARVPLTYRELCQRIYDQYVQWGWRAPVPLTEGPGLDREVLGAHSWPTRNEEVAIFPGQVVTEKPGVRTPLRPGLGPEGLGTRSVRSQFLLTRDGQGPWQIKAGLLHGLTEGSFLAVHPPAGEGDKVLGHVQVKQSQPTEAEVVPCAYASLPSPQELPRSGRCVPVFVDFGDLRLRVATDGDAETSAGAPQLTRRLTEIARAPNSPIELTGDRRKADVLARLKAGKVYLVSADQAQLPLATHFGPYSLDPADQLPQALTRIARARNLLRLAGGSGDGLDQDGATLGLEVSMLRLKGRDDSRAETLTWQRGGVTLAAGDWVAWRLVNRGRESVDVSLLFIDNHYGIHALFPHPNTTADNRLGPGQVFTTRPVRVNAKTTGLEHLAVIAVRADGQPVDFTCLAQPTVEQAVAKAAKNRAGVRALHSPLGRLLQNALYARGSVRGLGVAEVDNSVLRLLSWQVRGGAK